MKNILALLVLAGLTVVATGCGGSKGNETSKINLTCDDVVKKEKELHESEEAFGKVLAETAPNKEEAKKQRDLYARNCKELTAVAPMKCKFEGETEEREVKGEEYKNICDANLNDMDSKLK